MLYNGRFRGNHLPQSVKLLLPISSAPIQLIAVNNGRKSVLVSLWVWTTTSGDLMNSHCERVRQFLGSERGGNGEE